MSPPSPSRSPWLPIVVVLLVCALLPARAAEDGWPREFGRGGRSVLVYEPQVEQWSADGRLQLRAPLAVTAGRGEPARYGVLGLDSPTEIDAGTQSVLLADPQARASFSDLPPAEADRLQAIVREALPPGRPLTLSLPALIAAGGTPPATAPEVAVDLQPPPIFHSSRPATLLSFDGPPVFEPLGDGRLQAATNTGATVLYEPGARRYWLALDDGWLGATDLRTGAWTQPDALPPAFDALPADTWGALLANGPGRQRATVPAVIYSERPAELIVTEGPPRYAALPGTRLQVLRNSDSPVFVLPDTGRLYFLAAGRWFSAPTLAGPWQAATTDLPAEFSRIPPDGSYGWVLASVPGTPAAAEAVTLAGVPRKASVPRTGLRYEPVYEGDPRYEPIDGTGGVQWIPNTRAEVLRYEDRYYGVDDGVWFESAAPRGPWLPAERVPEAIYRIPPAHPLYHVTYVRIYEHTPQTITYGYTPGYDGQYVSHGVLMFGLGALAVRAIGDGGERRPWYRPDRTWGYGAVYRPGRGFAPRGWAYGRYRPKPPPVAYDPRGRRWTPLPPAPEVRRVTTLVLSERRTQRTQASVLPGTPFAGPDRYRRWDARPVAADTRWQQARRLDTGRPAPAALRRDGALYVGRDGGLYRRTPRDDWQRVAGDGRTVAVERAQAVRAIAAPDGRPGPGASRRADAAERGRDEDRSPMPGARRPDANADGRPDAPRPAPRPDAPRAERPQPPDRDARRPDANADGRPDAPRPAPRPDAPRAERPQPPDRDARRPDANAGGRPDAPRPAPRPDAPRAERPQPPDRDARRPDANADGRPDAPRPAPRPDAPRAERPQPPDRDARRPDARPDAARADAARAPRPQAAPQAERPQPATRPEPPAGHGGGRHGGRDDDDARKGGGPRGG